MFIGKNTRGPEEQVCVGCAESSPLRASHGVTSDKADALRVHELTEGLVGPDLHAAYIGHTDALPEANTQDLSAQLFETVNRNSQNDEDRICDGLFKNVGDMGPSNSIQVI